MKSIYLDYAAATPLRDEVVEAMRGSWQQTFGNPSSIHAYGRAAKEALEAARLSVAGVLKCNYDELIFTASGTESVTLALKGASRVSADKRHIITSQIEHPAVLSTCEQLRTEGFEITYIPVDSHGLVNVKNVEEAIRHDTCLISIMYANNEIGTIQPIAEIGLIAKKHGILFHTDACQAAGTLNINVNDLGVDLLTINGSKIYGPKGVGLLYVRRGTVLEPLMPGGGQENGLRGGTENVAGIIGLSKALELAENDKERQSKHLTGLRDYMITALQKMPGFHLCGHTTQRLANNIHGRFDVIEGQALVGLLDQEGIAASTASACSAADPDPSHVLLAIGLTYGQSFEGIRFSLGRETTREDIDYCIEKLHSITAHLTKEAN